MFGNISDAPFDRADVSRPLRATPDLDVVVHADDRDVRAEPGGACEAPRHEHAREDEALHLARLARERVEGGDPLDARLPALARIDVDGAVDPANEDDV